MGKRYFLGQLSHSWFPSSDFPIVSFNTLLRFSGLLVVPASILKKIYSKKTLKNIASCFLRHATSTCLEFQILHQTLQIYVYMWWRCFEPETSDIDCILHMFKCNFIPGETWPQLIHPTQMNQNKNRYILRTIMIASPDSRGSIPRLPEEYLFRGGVVFSSCIESKTAWVAT